MVASSLEYFPHAVSVAPSAQHSQGVKYVHFAYEHPTWLHFVLSMGGVIITYNMPRVM